jgi:hypothetical protein
MKKLLVVVSVLFVVALFAGPLFAASMYDPEQRNAILAEKKAAPLKAGGEFTFGMMTPFDSDYAGIGYANAYVDFFLYVDEYNTLMLELGFAKEYSSNPSLGLPGVAFPYFELNTDVGKALDLPVGLINTIGSTSIYTNKYEVTGHAWERTKIRSSIDPVPWKIKVDAGKVQVTTGIGFGERTNDATVPWAIPPGGVAPPHEKGQFNDFGVYAFIPEVGPAEVELWYLTKDNPDFKGDLGFSVKTKPLFNEMVSFAGGFRYNLVDGSAAPGSPFWSSFGYKDTDPATTGIQPDGMAADEKFWAWGVGAKTNLAGAAIGLSVNGDVADAFDQLAVDVEYMFGESPFGVDVDAGFSFASDAPTAFLGAEFSVFAKIGAAKWNVGYLLDGDDEDQFGYAYSVAKVFPGSKGGLFVVGDIDF